jgi:hypothetical protein
MIVHPYLVYRWGASVIRAQRNGGSDGMSCTIGNIGCRIGNRSWKMLARKGAEIRTTGEIFLAETQRHGGNAKSVNPLIRNTKAHRDAKRGNVRNGMKRETRSPVQDRFCEICVLFRLRDLRECILSRRDAKAQRKCEIR